MTDREIRHLSKAELLSIIRDQEQELQQAGERTAELQRRLEDKKTHLEACGSIAEASLQINQVFQAAQAAADQYLAEVREKHDRLDAETERLLAEARQKADAQVRAAAESCQKREEESSRRAGACWDALQQQLEAFYESHQGLEKMLAACGMDVKIPHAGVKQEDDKQESAASQS